MYGQPAVEGCKPQRGAHVRSYPCLGPGRPHPATSLQRNGGQAHDRKQKRLGSDTMAKDRTCGSRRQQDSAPAERLRACPRGEGERRLASGVHRRSDDEDESRRATTTDRPRERARIDDDERRTNQFSAIALLGGSKDGHTLLDQRTIAKAKSPDQTIEEREMARAHDGSRAHEP